MCFYINGIVFLDAMLPVSTGKSTNIWMFCMQKTKIWNCNITHRLSLYFACNKSVEMSNSVFIAVCAW